VSLCLLRLFSVSHDHCNRPNGLVVACHTATRRAAQMRTVSGVWATTDWVVDMAWTTTTEWTLYPSLAAYFVVVAHTSALSVLSSCPTVRP
jgi:hypothetical protein